MKIIFHQAIRIGICDRIDVADIEVEEVLVITLFDKQVFPIITAIVDVVILFAD
jgi:hypothetical protein